MFQLGEIPGHSDNNNFVKMKDFDGNDHLHHHHKKRKHSLTRAMTRVLPYHRRTKQNV